MKIEHIVETQGEFCIRCHKRKRGKFMIIYLESEDSPYIRNRVYIAICKECLEEKGKLNDLSQ